MENGKWSRGFENNVNALDFVKNCDIILEDKITDFQQGKRCFMAGLLQGFRREWKIHSAMSVLLTSIIT